MNVVPFPIVDEGMTHFEGDACAPDGHRAEMKLAREAGFPTVQQPLTKVGPPVAAKDLALIIMTVVEDREITAPNEILDRFAQELATDRIAPTLARVTAMISALERLRTVWDVRYGAEIGERDYYDQNGEQYVYGSDDRKEVENPVGLIEGLRAEGVSIRSIASAVSKAGFRLTGLKQIVDDTQDPNRKKAIQRIIFEHVDRRSGPKHLSLRKP